MFGNDNFMKSFNSKKFFDGFIPLKEKTYCVVVVYDNDHSKEFYGIINPWRFINGMKKDPRVKKVYIKDENSA